MNSGTTPICGYCGRPIVMTAMWSGGTPYHYECTRGPSASPTYAPMPPAKEGCKPVTMLTEKDVRRIVREELGHNDPGKQPATTNHTKDENNG